jgi:type II secretory pathway predicted ATPase ExeA
LKGLPLRFLGRRSVSRCGRGLEPLTWAETVRYIAHRLQVAGYVGAPLFTPEAVEEIWEHCKGIPRNINNLCFNALLMGYSEVRRPIIPLLWTKFWLTSK